MKIKFKSIIVISILFLCALFIDWDFNLKAKNLDDEINKTSISRFDKYPRAGNFNWGPIEVISEPIPNLNYNINSSNGPKIAVEDGKIYMVWHDNTDYSGAGGDLDIFYRYFDGNKWSKIQVISEPVPGQNINTEDSFSPDIAVEKGKISVTWGDRNNTNSAGTDDDIIYRCNLTGTNWESIQVISEPISGSNFNMEESSDPSIAVKNDKIYVVWHDKNDTKTTGTDYDIFYRCNLTGNSWEDIQVISEPVPSQNLNTGTSVHPEIVVENGRIYVVWDDGSDINRASTDDDIFFRCNLTGFTWEDIQVISEPVQNKNFNTGMSNSPVISVENNKIYIVWMDRNDTNGAGTDQDIFYRCNLIGTKWEDIQVISEPTYHENLNTGSSKFPNIAVENGKIYVVWYDTNETNGAGTDLDIFYKCNLTSYIWEPVQIISEPAVGNDFNIGWSGEPDITVHFGKSYIVWCGNNNTNTAGTDWDIFYRYLHLPLILSYPSVKPVFGNTSTNFNFTITYFHYDNITPTKIIVNISGIEYSMFEVNPSDINYIDGKDYFFNIKNLDIGIRNYQFYASDSKFTWPTRIVNKPIVYNTKPIISKENNLTAFEDTYYKVDYNYNDIDLANVGQTGIWEFSTNAEWLTFNISAAIFNGTPTNNDVGEYWVNISINDTMDIDYINSTLTVINVNDAPIIITEDSKVTKEDEYYENYYKATDVDSPQDNLFWNMQTNASWLDFEHSTAKLSGTPENGDVGKFWINISVSDIEYNDYSNFTLRVINVNDPPRIITKDDTTALEDEFYEISYEAEDVDNTLFELFWDINTNAKWLNYDISNAVINGTPTNDDIGEYWVNISVSDIEYVDLTNFTLTVENINDPPIIIIEDVKKAIVGELYSVNYEVIDVDPTIDKITWSLKTNAGNWLKIDSITGWLNGEPSESDIGKYWVNVIVSDGEGGLNYHNFTITVESLEDKISKEEMSWYWLSWIFIFIIIIASAISFYLNKKRKAARIPTVRAELILAQPQPRTLPDATLDVERYKPLPTQPVIQDQLPTPKAQVQPGSATSSEKIIVPSLTSAPVSTQFQLPKATLTKEQKLGLLQERFLRGEVTEETYKKLRDEIEESLNVDNTSE